MKKRLLSLLLCALLLCTLPVARAQSAYPDCAGTVTDLALVLSPDTVADLETLSERYHDATDGSLYVVTRHFLGGRDAWDYAGELFEAWELENQDVLLLMVIGEESYALYTGSSAASALPEESIRTFFATSFHEPFLLRHYDQAAADMAVQTLTRIADAHGQSLRTTGLFGAPAQKNNASAFTQDIDSLFATFFEQDEPAPERERHVLEEDKSTGISLWKVLIIILIVRSVLKKRRRRNFGHHPYR